MNSKTDLRCRRTLALIALCITSMAAPMVSTHSATGLLSQERRAPTPELVLEIAAPNYPHAPLRLGVSSRGRSMTLLPRQQLTINAPKLAADLTAVDVWADGEGDSIRVRLSIIYNDLSNQEWWKDKKETVLGSFLVSQGEPVRVSELARFGIEPFEMRVVKTTPVVVFQPGEGPHIINNTQALQVARVEKAFEGYSLWLKNASSKNVISYTIRSGNSGIISTYETAARNLRPAIAAGAISEEIHLDSSRAEKDGIRIQVVVFEDGTYEGDSGPALRYLVAGEGRRIQAPSLVRAIEQTLEVNDENLPKAFEKLEAQLWAIPEAIDKQSALELLKSRYPSFDGKTISDLYEVLKGGLYDARNMALSPIGDVKRRLQESERPDDSNLAPTRTILLRETLIRIKSDIQGLLEAKR